MDTPELPASAPPPSDDRASRSYPMPAPDDGSCPGPRPAPQDPGDGSDLSFSTVRPLPEDDFDLDQHLDWLMGEIDAGRQHVPPESQQQGPAISISLGDASDLDPELLVAICGPDGLAGPGNQELNAAFAEDRPADMLRPGPVLVALTEQAFAGLGGLTDNELAGALHAAVRLENRAFYLQTRAIAELARRRAAQFEADKARKVPRGCRRGEYPDQELAAELLISRYQAQRLIDTATDLTTRLPRTLAGMADGTIDPSRAMTIATYTTCLSPEDAAKADEVLTADAAEIRTDTLGRRAQALEMKLDPEAARRRREHAKNTRQRVEARREQSGSGNASLCGRELGTAEVMAADANLKSIAARLRNAGLTGTIDAIRARAYLDLLQSRNPFDRLAPIPPEPADDYAPDPAGTFDDQACGLPGDEDDRHPAAPAGDAGDQDDDEARYPADPAEDEDGVRYPAGPGTPAGGLAPLPALVNLIVVARRSYARSHEHSGTGRIGGQHAGGTRAGCVARDCLPAVAA